MNNHPIFRSYISKTQTYFEFVCVFLDYFYYAEGWGQCQGTCPIGVQFRTVVCLATLTKTLAPTELLCSELVKPITQQNCPLTCGKST